MSNYEEEFKAFNIDPKNYPKYDTPEKFAHNFERCSILSYVNVTYSNNSISSK